MASGGNGADPGIPPAADGEDTTPKDETGQADGVTSVLNQTFIREQTNVTHQYLHGIIVLPGVQCGPAEPSPYKRPEHSYPENDPAVNFKVRKRRDVSILFRDEELERKVEQPYITIVAKSVDSTKGWRRLARKLKLTSSDFGMVEMYKPDGIQEQIYQTLNLWRKRHPEATVKDMVKGLSEGDLHDAAIELMHSFRSLHCLEWNPSQEKPNDSGEKGNWERQGEKGGWMQPPRGRIPGAYGHDDESNEEEPNEDDTEELSDEEKEELSEEDTDKFSEDNEAEYVDKGENKGGFDQDKDVDEAVDQDKDVDGAEDGNKSSSPIKSLRKKLAMFFK